MPGFPKPKNFRYSIDVERERSALREHRAARQIPKRQDGHLLLATWNIANLGAREQVRDEKCYRLLAEVIGYFDLLVVQEVRDNVKAARYVLATLPKSWKLMFSESGGNDERFAFFWDSDVVELGQLVGKMIFEPKELERAGGDGFQGFSRTPYIGTFHRGKLRLEVVSVHSFFGKTKNPLDMARRLAETKAVGYWCETRSKDPDSYTPDIMAMGDFNTPSEDDLPLATKMLDDLRSRGLHTPRYESAQGDQVLETQVGTAVRSENHYDHLLFFPENTSADLERCGVFDFDKVIFSDLFENRNRTKKDFTSYVVWAISDHRPLWAQLKAPA